MSRTLGAIAALAACVAAQPPQLWERLTPTLPTGVDAPAATSFRRMIAASGAVVTFGNDPVTGANATFAYDPTTNLLTEYPLAPGGRTPDIVAFGGNIIAYGSSAADGSTGADTFYFLSQSTGSANPAWNTITLTAAGSKSGIVAPERAGARSVLFGNTLFRFFGADASNPSTVHSDVWAIDIGDLLNSQGVGQPIGWQLVMPDGTVPGLYPRRDFAVEVVGRGIWVSLGWNGQFGSGLAHYNDGWFVHPTSAFSTAAKSVLTSASWVQIPATGPSPAGMIPPRGGSAHGCDGHWCIVYGGFNDQAQDLTDMWAFSLETFEWFSLPVPNPAPQLQPGRLPGGTFLGRHFYLVLAASDNANDVQWWRWSIIPQPYTPTPAPYTGNAGHTFGIALTCLVVTAQLIMFVYVARKEGWISFGLPSCSIGGGGTRYTKSSFTPGVSGSGPGAYAAPATDDAVYTATA